MYIEDAQRHVPVWAMFFCEAPDSKYSLPTVPVEMFSNRLGWTLIQWLQELLSGFEAIDSQAVKRASGICQLGSFSDCNYDVVFYSHHVNNINTCTHKQ